MYQKYQAVETSHITVLCTVMVGDNIRDHAINMTIFSYGEWVMVMVVITSPFRAFRIFDLLCLSVGFEQLD